MPGIVRGLNPGRAMAMLLRLSLLVYVADLAAATGLLLALVGGHRGLALALLVLAWVLVLARGLDQLVKALRYAVGPTGGGVLARVLVVLGVAVLLQPTGAGWAAVAVLVVALLTEVLSVPIARAAVPLVANLPGVRVRNEPLLLPKHVFGANTGAIVVVGGALALGVPDGVVLALAFVLALPTLVVLIDGALRVGARRVAEQRLASSLRAYAPTFLVHFNAPHGSEHQLTMWLPQLERLGAPYVLVLRNPTTFDEVVAQTERPVLLRRYAGELDNLVVPSLRTVFYVNTSPRNEHMLRFLEIQHVQLNHGDSDKAASYRRVFRSYDKNFVAGQAAIDRFARHGVKVPDDSFEIVGRPQVEGVVVRPGPAPRVGATVLYAPTWQGYHDDSRYSSLPVGTQLVTALLERGCTVVFRPHPWSRRDPALVREVTAIIALLRADTDRHGRPHVFGPGAETERSLGDCFNLADAMVADVSSVVGDFLFSEKPLAVVDMGDRSARSGPDATAGADGAARDRGLLEEFPVARAAYVLPGRRMASELERVLDDLLVHDPAGAERQVARRYYLGPFPADRYADAFLEAARPYVEPVWGDRDRGGQGDRRTGLSI